MENEPEEQVESPGDYENDDIPDLSTFIPDDAQRGRRGGGRSHLKIRFAIPQTCKMTKRIGRRPCHCRLKKINFKSRCTKSAV